MADALPSIAILRTGTFTDVRGTKVTFTRRDLEDVASSYDADRAPAVLVIGHPGVGAPSYGHVGRIEFTGDRLRAHPTNVAPAFAEAVKAGRWRKVSPQLFQPTSPGNPRPGHWYLQHVGFLGAAPPAIKGLGTVSFTQADRRGAIAFALPQPLDVEFVAPAGYSVDNRHGDLHARALALRAANPAMTFWDGFTRAQDEARIVALAEQAGTDPVDQGRAERLMRAHEIATADPEISLYEAYKRASFEPPFLS